MTKQHVLIWAPYEGQPGEKKILETIAGTLQDALDHTYRRQRAWRKEHGEGQVIIATVCSYMGLHG